MSKIYISFICIILLYGCEQNKSKSIATPIESEILLIKGTATYSDAELPLELLIDQKGMFIVKIGGWANQITGYDDENIWRMDNGVITVENINIGPLIIDKLNFVESKKILTEISNNKASKILGEPVMGVLG